jgi:hypothetical protein
LVLKGNELALAENAVLFLAIGIGSDDHRGKVSFGHKNAVDAGFAPVEPDIALARHLGQVEAQRIARADRLAELRLVDRGEQHAADGSIVAAARADDEPSAPSPRSSARRERPACPENAR